MSIVYPAYLSSIQVVDLLAAINSLSSDSSLDSAVTITPVETHPSK